MSLFDELYTKRQYLADLAECDAILRCGRELICDKRITGVQFERDVVPLEARARKAAKRRWADNGRWFGALARAKREWNLKHFGEHDYEALKKLNFLKAVVAKILEGAPERVERIIAPIEGTGPWCRERRSRDMNRGFMPECEYEICTGGHWRPVQKADLPDRVRWV